MIESDIPIVNIQTIYDYCCAVNIQLDPFEFPCIKPPFEKMELRFHTQSVDTNTKELLDCRSVVIDNNGQVGVSVNFGLNGKWVGVAVWSFDYNEDGTPGDEFGLLDVRQPEILVEAFGHVQTLAACALYAVSFMHVKGAAIEEPRHVSRQARRQWHRSKQKIHVLRIEPLERVMRQYSEAGTGSKRRVHLVRGHFKDYRHGAGVGGNPKARGLYWTPPHIRGSKELGVVAKQYETGSVLPLAAGGEG